MQSDREKQIEYNLTVLRRRDQAITEIKDMAGHVVLYQFNEDTKAWDRKGVEGALFVVERSTEPQYQFVVLNRLSSENLVETVDANFQLELTEQFLLYRNLKQEILGIWFYSSPERSAISELLNALASAAGDDTGAADPDGGPDDEPAADDEPTEAAPADGAALAQFFNMVQVQDAPPMPAGAATAAELATAPSPAAEAPVEPAQPTPVPTELAMTELAASPEPASAPTAAPQRPPVDMDALKSKLAAQLRSLLDDDAFLSMLANEYLRQQQRAIQQAQQQRQQRASSRGASAKPAAAAPAPTSEPVSTSVPAHLAALMAQQSSI